MVTEQPWTERDQHFMALAFEQVGKNKCDSTHLLGLWRMG